jgi:predicted RNase H-like nuclease (RuvC/YqgF family)
MPRKLKTPKLKTYVTNLGFFELAVAAPSMKAALAAWGLTHNVFAQDLAKETKDASIVAAAEAKPGTVLRRPIGSHGAFTEHAELPKVKAAKKPKPAKPKINKAAQAARDKLSRALAAHQKKVEALEKERDQLDDRFERESARWQDEKERLENALAKAERRGG